MAPTACGRHHRPSWTRGATRRGSGFQIIQSWLALGNGGLVGQGIGGSRQKLLLPAGVATPTFIFAVLGEELGFVGAVGPSSPCSPVLIWRGLRIGLRRPTRSARTWRSASPCCWRRRRS